MAKKKSGIFKRLIKLVLFLVLLLALIVGGFALGVYLQVFDTNEINERMQLYNLPVVGEYFPVPPGAERVTAKTEEKKPAEKTKTEKRVFRSKKKPAAPAESE